MDVNTRPISDTRGDYLTCEFVPRLEADNVVDQSNEEDQSSGWQQAESEIQGVPDDVTRLQRYGQQQEISEKIRHYDGNTAGSRNLVAGDFAAAVRKSAAAK